jgi:hypothetical protein
MSVEHWWDDIATGIRDVNSSHTSCISSVASHGAVLPVHIMKACGKVGV